MVAPQKSIRCTSDRGGHARNFGKIFGGKSYRDAILKGSAITNQKMVSNEKMVSEWKKVQRKNMVKAIDREYKQERRNYAGLYSVKLKKISKFIDEVKSFKPTKKAKDSKFWEKIDENKRLFAEFEEKFEEMVKEYDLKKKIEDEKVRVAAREKKKGWHI